MRIGINKSHVDIYNHPEGFSLVLISKQVNYPEASHDRDLWPRGKFTPGIRYRILIEAFQIPWFSEIKGLVSESSGLVPRLKIIGWDVAIDPDGRFYIEGNTTPRDDNFRNCPERDSIITRFFWKY